LNSICIIGLGKLGSHLYYSLNKTAKFRVRYAVKNSRAKIKPEEINKCGIILICTSDSKIINAVNELKKKNYNLEKKYIYHTSGAFNSDLLKPLEQKGAFTGSFHPVQTFESKVTSRSKRLNNIYIAAEGSRKAVKKAKEITMALEAKAVVLTADDKLLHHINSVIASNYLVAFFHQIESISQLISGTYQGKKGQVFGFKKTSFFNIYKSLIEQTLSNIELKGTADSLTGPIARNDIKTVAAHVKIINDKIPHLLPFYSLMGTEAVKLALKKKSINKPDAKILLKELNKTVNIKKKRKKIEKAGF
jgi:predicted short-subunit dehydrogenase-like oxidoreductase (DUF2520 family)